MDKSEAPYAGHIVRSKPYHQAGVEGMTAQILSLETRLTSAQATTQVVKQSLADLLACLVSAAPEDCFDPSDPQASRPSFQVGPCKHGGQHDIRY